MSTKIGPARCLVCGSGQATASVMKTQRVCIVCNSCRCQTFARGDQADELLRRTIEGHADRRADPAPAAAPSSSSSSSTPTAKPAPAAPVQSWGLF